MIPGVTINTDIDTGVIINKINYYISFVIGIYYNLNGIIGLNVLNISLIYLLLT